MMEWKGIASATGLSFALLSGAAAAQTTGGTSAYDGLYAGVAAGYDRLSADTKGTILGVSDSGSDHTDGVVGGGFIGYGHTFGPAYGGIEIEGLYGDNDFSESAGGFTGKVKQRGSADAAVRIGVAAFDRVMVYGRAGWAMTRFRGSVSGPLVDERGTEWLNGPRVGGGVEMNIAYGLFGRLDYSHTWYDAKTFGSDAASLKIDPDEDLVTLGVGYRF